MFYAYNHLLKLVTNKENIKTLRGQQISFDLKSCQLPTILHKKDINKVIIELLDDLRSPSDEKSFRDRSICNRQWRFYGADEDGNNGVDQLERLCSFIKSKKPDRRLLLVSLNPRDERTLALSQCLLQFYVSGNLLSCKVYQTSATLGNIIRYDSCRATVLTLILCHMTGMLPGRLVHSFGSVIIGSDNVTLTEEQRFPILVFRGHCAQLEEFSLDNFELCDGSGVVDSPASNTICIPNSHGHEEMQYLNLISSIIKDGVTLVDRTGVGTRSIFGPQMVFSLHNGALPLITTKRVFCRGIIEELLWFLRGSTNGNELAAKNVHIWDANGSKEFLTSVGLGHREAGDLGPVYGFQWRHFGATYEDMDAKYSGKGVDQVAKVIESIKKDPEGGNHIVLAWNAKDIGLMALPPCHCLMQFFVDGDELSCELYQRSCDMGLGVPFNIASYALLTHMIAHVTNLKPGYFIHSLGDAHVYLNHIEPLQTQLQREPIEFPTLRFPRTIHNIEDFVIEDFIVDNYKPHPKIAMEMAV